MLDKPSRDIVKVYVVRHARAVGQDSARIIGRSNELPLTISGKKDAAVLGRELARLNLRSDLIYSSPAIRALDTAEIALRAMKSGLERRIIKHDALAEVSQGSWEGLERRSVYTPRVREMMSVQGLDFMALGGESVRQGGKRFVKDFLVDEFRGHVSPGRELQVLAFGHSLVTRAGANELGSLPTERVLTEEIPNCSVNLFVRENGHWTMRYLGKSALEI